MAGAARYTETPTRRSAELVAHEGAQIGGVERLLQPQIRNPIEEPLRRWREPSAGEEDHARGLPRVGLHLSSCATPAANVPMDTIRSATSRRFCRSRSRVMSRTSVTMASSP